ncbi:hypothetical protein H7X65_02570 [Candidatus Parcubacteria bacterium]|nr:hypothetical protein [Candidatus Parcubacteria bacterium]
MNRLENLKGMYLLTIVAVAIIGLLLWQKLKGPNPYPGEENELGEGETQDPRIPT